MKHDRFDRVIRSFEEYCKSFDPIDWKKDPCFIIEIKQERIRQLKKKSNK